jgi:hypothetical protein
MRRHARASKRTQRAPARTDRCGQPGPARAHPNEPTARPTALTRPKRIKRPKRRRLHCVSPARSGGSSHPNGPDSTKEARIQTNPSYTNSSAFSNCYWHGACGARPNWLGSAPFEGHSRCLRSRASWWHLPVGSQGRPGCMTSVTRCWKALGWPNWAKAGDTERAITAKKARRMSTTPRLA